MIKNKFLNVCLLVFLSFILLLLTSCEGESSSSDNNSSNTLSNDSQSVEGNNSSIDDHVSQSAQDDGKYADEGELKLRIFKMGKSDCYLFRTSSKVIMIDCGDVDDSQEILDYFTEKAITKIDYMIVTHLDKKSIGGASALIKSLNVGTVYEPNYVKNSVEYLDFSSALSEKNITSQKVTSQLSFEVDGVSFNIIPCEKTYYSSDDNYSSAISVIHGNNSFLFVGDSKEDRIKEIISLSNIKHDFLMMPDNGVYDTMTENLITAVEPSYAAITCSTKNPASTEVLSLLSKKGINTYLTTNGSIRITSNGSKITIEQ